MREEEEEKIKTRGSRYGSGVLMCLQQREREQGLGWSQKFKVADDADFFGWVRTKRSWLVWD